MPYSASSPKNVTKEVHELAGTFARLLISAFIRVHPWLKVLL